MGPIGAQEMVFIVLLALLLFGPKKLPELGRLLGKGLTEFRRAKNELKTTFESHMQELEREAKLSETPKSSTTSQPESTPYSSAPYPYPYDEYGRQDAASNSPSEPIDSQPVQPFEQVPGTVPRSKPAQPAEPASVAGEGNHPA